MKLPAAACIGDLLRKYRRTLHVFVTTKTWLHGHGPPLPWTCSELKLLWCHNAVQVEETSFFLLLLLASCRKLVFFQRKRAWQSERLMSFIVIFNLQQRQEFPQEQKHVSPTPSYKVSELLNLKVSASLLGGCCVVRTAIISKITVSMTSSCHAWATITLLPTADEP